MHVEPGYSNATLRTHGGQIAMDEPLGARPATTSSARRFYRPELDMLRFAAFLGVFSFHRMDFVSTDPSVSPWAWRIGTVGAFGVPVFFLLSAFLLTELLLREQEVTGRVHVPAFYVRRALRIWPLYFAAFYGLTFLNLAIPGVGAADPRAWLAFTFFAGNWWVTFRGWIAGPVDPLWSISVEEQFYLAIPLVIALGGRRALALTSVALLVVAYAVIGSYAWSSTPGDHGQWTNSFVQFQFFAAGVLAALALRGRLPRWPAGLRLTVIALGLLCWFIAVIGFQVRSWDPQPSFAGAFVGWALVLLGTVLLFLATLGSTRVPRWAAHLGRISYGLYVYHSLVLMLVFTYALPRAGLVPSSLVGTWLGTVLAFAISIGLAHLSFRWFEQPILRFKRRFSFVQSRV